MYLVFGTYVIEIYVTKGYRFTFIKFKKLNKTFYKISKKHRNIIKIISSKFSYKIM